MRRIGRYRYIPSVHIVLDCVVLPRSIHIEVMLTLSSVFTSSSNGADMGNGSAREPPVLSIPLKPQNCPRKRPFSNATRRDSDQCENFFWGVADFLSWHSHLLKAVAYMTIDERRGSVETRRPGRQHFHGHRRPVVPLLLLTSSPSARAGSHAIDFRFFRDLRGIERAGREGAACRGACRTSRKARQKRVGVRRGASLPRPAHLTPEVGHSGKAESATRGQRPKLLDVQRSCQGWFMVPLATTTTTPVCEARGA